MACDKLTLEASSRKCIKAISKARHFDLMLQLQRNSEIKLLTEHQHINWTATSFMLNYNLSDKDNAATSFAQHRQRSFKYKIFSQELPTLSCMRRQRSDLYPSADCLSCQRHKEFQSHFWTCSSHQDQWRMILNQATTMLTNILHQSSSRHRLTHEQLQVCLHESRTFISKGIVPTSLFDLVSSVCRSLPNTHLTLAKVYNYIYRQVFTHIWKPRYAKVIAHEQTLGISNCTKRLKNQSTTFQYLPKQQGHSAPFNTANHLTCPWVYWFTASIKQGLSWISYVYSPKAEMFRSFTTSAICSVTNPKDTNRISHRFSIDSPNLIDSLVLV